MVGNEKELLEFIRSMTPGTLVADIVEASVFHMVHEKWRSFSRAFQDQFATLLMQAIKHAKPLNIEGDIPPIA